MGNEEKASKGLIILALILVILAIVAWTTVLVLFLSDSGNYGLQEKEKSPALKETADKIDNEGQSKTLKEEGDEQYEIVFDEETIKRLEDTMNKYDKKNVIIDEDIDEDVEYLDISQNSPDNYELNTASYITSKYLECWEKQDWLTMVKYTQNSWAKKHDNSKERLEAQYSSKELLGAQIIDEEKQGENLTKVTYKVWYKFLDGEISIKLMVANVIREDGKWGVNPISALREKEI